MQIPVLNGIYTDENSDFRTSYPKNLIPVPKENGISSGYLRPADGIELFGSGPGVDRGGINWNGSYFRVMGTKLVKILSNGTHIEIGDVGGSEQVTFDYSFDYLAVASDGSLYLYDNITLQKVADPDLGYVKDIVWIDGYFMTTDGDYIIVTELGDPFSVNPLKYGSSEVNPDKINAILKLRNEAYVINRYTIEVFDNTGGANFPFQRINGAQIERGSIGTHTACIFANNIAFIGGALNESNSIWLGNNGGTTKISTREIDQILQEYTEDQLSKVVVETKLDKSNQHLFIHLPDKTIVFDAFASQAIGQPIWFILSSSLVGTSKYRARNFVYCYDKWLCADPTSTKHGILVDNVSSHYGDVVGWEFGTQIVYNSGNGAIFHEIELIALTGRVQLGLNPTIWTSWSEDGETFSQEFAIQAGKIGQRNIRLSWIRQGVMQHWRIQKFRGTSDAHMSIARLEARIEGLSN